MQILDEAIGISEYLVNNVNDLYILYHFENSGVGDYKLLGLDLKKVIKVKNFFKEVPKHLYSPMLEIVNDKYVYIPKIYNRHEQVIGFIKNYIDKFIEITGQNINISLTKKYTTFSEDGCIVFDPNCAEETYGPCKLRKAIKNKLTIKDFCWRIK